MKRKWEPRLYKKGGKVDRLRGRNFVYTLVEDGNIIKKPDISVILTKYVKGLGFAGDVVKVRPIYAYSNLILPGLAVYDSEENRKKHKTDLTDQENRRSPNVERTVSVFEKRIIAVCMNKFEPWVIEPWHIRASMRKAGMYVLNDSQIELPQTPITGPDPVKQNKEFTVTVTINNEEKAVVRCRIHHWSLDPKTREPYGFEHWKQPAEPLFSELESNATSENISKDQPTSDSKN